MNLDEKKLRNYISQHLRKLNGLSETDLVASDKSSWDNKKTEFKTLIKNLLSKIEKDDYDDAAGEISKSISILKTWKSKIDKGLTDNSLQENDGYVPAHNMAVHYVGDGFARFIVPNSAKYTSGPDDEASYTLEVNLAIPKSGFSSAEEALEDTKKALNFNSYNGPGQAYSKGYLHLEGEDTNNYIFVFSISGGYDI